VSQKLSRWWDASINGVGAIAYFEGSGGRSATAATFLWETGRVVSAPLNHPKMRDASAIARLQFLGGDRAINAFFQ
jgi:hypothetical protein